MEGYPKCTDGDIGQCATGNGGYAENTQGPQYWNPASPIPHIYIPNNGGTTIYNTLYQEEPWREMVHCFDGGLDSKPVWMSVGFIAQKINNIKIYDMTTWLTNCGVQSDGSVIEEFCSKIPCKSNYLYILLIILIFIILTCFIIGLIFEKPSFKNKRYFFLDINK
jgi:hypothetical protein